MRLIENLSILSIEEFLTESRKPRNWDIFISCGGFEERCKRSSEFFFSKNVKIDTSIIFNYKEVDPENKKEENIQEMKINLEKVCNYIHIFDTESVSLPSKGIKKFFTFLKENNICLLNKNVIIDVTVFAKAYFFLLFKVLKEKFSLHKFYVVYTEPQKYKTKNTDTDEIILTEGLDRVESIPGFTGSSINSENVLIVILGFEGKRSKEVFSSVEPKFTYAVNGFPSFQPGWHKISFEENLPFLEESGASEHLFFAPAVDPFETRNTISQIVEEIESNNKNTNIIISPLGTKLQAFGVLLYALENKKIKIIYPIPSVYKPDYSYKYGPTWIFKINLNKYGVESK